MAQKELLASLWRKGEATITELKADAEQQAAAIEKEFAERLREKKQAFQNASSVASIALPGRGEIDPQIS